MLIGLVKMTYFNKYQDYSNVLALSRICYCNYLPHVKPSQIPCRLFQILSVSGWGDMP